MRSFLHLIIVAVAGAFIAGFLSGCAKAPDQELAAVKAAIKATQEAEADKYMPNNYQNMQKALASAEAEIEMQNIAFALSRSYTKANQLLRNAKDLAAQITAELPQAKADIRAQVEEYLSSAQRMAQETRTDIKKASRLKKAKQALAQLTADLDAADIILDQAAKDLSAGNILDARKKLADAQEQLKKIFTQLKIIDPYGSLL